MGTSRQVAQIQCRSLLINGHPRIKCLAVQLKRFRHKRKILTKHISELDIVSIGLDLKIESPSYFPSPPD